MPGSSTPRSSWHELPTPPLCSLKPPRPRRPQSPDTTASPPPRRALALAARVRRKSQALLGPINSLPIPPSPPPGVTKARLGEGESIVPATLMNSFKKSQSAPVLPTPDAPLLCCPEGEDEEDEEIMSLLQSDQEPQSAPSPRPSSPSPPAPSSPPPCCLRPITPPPPKRGATATYLPGLVPLPRPASLPAFSLPAPLPAGPERREEQEDRDASLPPLLRARLAGSTTRLSLSPPASRPSSPPAARPRPASLPAHYSLGPASPPQSSRLSAEYRPFEAPAAAAPVRRILQPRVRQEPTLEVPLWTVEEVAAWVGRSGFQDYSPAFRECGVDGDMLLQLTNTEIRDDIGIVNGILRKRFIRELRELRKTADYTSCDGGLTANFLARVGQEYRGYTYQLILGELSLDLMQRLSAADLEDMLKDCGVESAIHRHKIVDAVINGTDDESFADSLYSEPGWDVYLSYPRAGAELASLIKMQLEVRGLAVSVDPRDSPCLSEASLVQVREARHMVLVLPPGGLDSCLGRKGGEEGDHLHAEILAALAAGTKIIPVTSDFQWPVVEDMPEDIREIASFNSVRWVHDYQDACLDKLDRFIRGELGSLKVDSPHSRLGRGSRGDSGRSTPSLLLPPASPTVLARFLKHRAASVDSDLGSQST